MRFPFAAAAVCVAALAVPASAEDLPPGAIVARDRIVVHLRPALAHAAYAQSTIARGAPPGSAALREFPSTLGALQSRLGATRLAPEFAGETATAGATDFTTFWIARVDPRTGAAAALAAARRDPDVLEASPVILVPVDPVTTPGTESQVLGAGRNAFTAAPPPNDSLWNLCWWLQQPSRRDLHALEAWEITRGDPSTVIAIIDTGVLWWHPDLGGVAAGDDGQIWINAAEAAGTPGVDDDGNGYVDDVRGWDFIALDSDTDIVVRAGEDWRDEDPDPTDFAVHGTAVAGVAAAKANNGAGTAGVAPGVRIMPLRAGFSALVNPAGLMDLSAVARAIRYAVRNGAGVINCSFSTSGTPDLKAAAEDATRAGVLLVVAAGNNGTTSYLGSLDQTIAVTATDSNDRLPAFANRGQWVDIAAPGQSIATTTLRATGADSVALRTPFYSPSEAGTSFSAPMVAAGLALLQSDRKAHGLPPLSPMSVLLRIGETADDISALNPAGGFGAGRLNLERLLTAPERSRALPATSRTIGPSAVVVGPAGDTLLVFATEDGGLLFQNARTGSIAKREELGATPAGGVATATLGPGLGTGVFVALQGGFLAGFDAGGRPLPGWPTAAAIANEDHLPALGDLDGDGLLEVVWGDTDGAIHACRWNGAPLSGFPFPVALPGARIGVALANLDACAGDEIVVTTSAGTVLVMNGAASVLPGWPQDFGQPLRSPIVAKLGADDTPSIVVGGGTLLAGFATGSARFKRGIPAPGITGELAAGDLTGDGVDEIVGMMDGGTTLFVAAREGSIQYQNTLDFVAGAPLIGPLTPGGAPVIVLDATNLAHRNLVVAFDGTTQALPGWPRPGDVSSALTLADVDGDGDTEVVAGAGADSLNYLYDAGPGTWNGAAAFWPTPRGDFARSGSRLHRPGLPNVAPPTIADLGLKRPAVHAATVQWTTPGVAGVTPDLARYDVRIGTTPLDDDAVFVRARQVAANLPRAAGNLDSLTVGGLLDGRSYWVAMRSSNVCGRWSATSNELAVALPAFPPAVVTDLEAPAVTESTVTLAWTASGEDGMQGRAQLYRIRASTGALDSSGFALATLGADVPASVPAGHSEGFLLTDLPRDTPIHIALRAIDSAGNASDLSNVIEVRLSGPPVIHRPFGFAVQSPAEAPVPLLWQGAPPKNSVVAGTISIYDATGRRMVRIPLATPSGTARWDGRGPTDLAPAGVYFAEIESAGSRIRRRFVLLR